MCLALFGFQSDTNVQYLGVIDGSVSSILQSNIFFSYQVDYDNHPLYKHGKTGRKQSPVRLFTNIAPRDIILPKDEGYRYQLTHSVTSNYDVFFYSRTKKIHFGEHQSSFLTLETVVFLELSVTSHGLDQQSVLSCHGDFSVG